MNTLRYIQTVLWSFIGLGRRGDFDEVTSKGKPAQLIIVAIVMAVLFVVVLVSLAMFAVSSLSNG
jgi:hypothetical protein